MDKKNKNVAEDKSVLINDKIFKKSIKKCFLIDYENVRADGLRGIADLDKHAAVIIFYSKNADKVPLDISRIFSDSKARLVHIKVGVGTRNALDFQLVSYLGYAIARFQELGIDIKYFMVTKDKGFDSVKYFWRKYGIQIHRVSQIERDFNEDEVTSTEEDTEKSVDRVKKGNTGVKIKIEVKEDKNDILMAAIKSNAIGPMTKDVDDIYKLVKQCKSKSALHTALQNKYRGRVKAQNISKFYQSIKMLTGY